MAADQWVRIVPTSFSQFDSLLFQQPAWDRSRPPSKGTFVVDWKTIPAATVFARRFNIVCDQALLLALEHVGARGWHAEPLLHASPNPVRGRRLYDIELPGRLGAPISPMHVVRPQDVPPSLPFGVAGAPVPPVVIDGSSWTGDVLCLSEWLSAESRAPFRALLARGDFVQALARHSDCDLRLEPVDVVNLGKASARHATVGTWVPAPLPWQQPSGWTTSVLTRITATARHYRHVLPAAPSATELERVATELERRFEWRLSTELRDFLLATNGASLFAHSLTFFPVGPRTAANAVPEHIAADDLASANDRVSEDDWRLTRAPGWVLFAARYASPHAIWAINPEGLVRLLLQTGEVLGPNLPFRAWLEDQVADLEWAWDTPSALGADRATWLDIDEEVVG